MQEDLIKETKEKMEKSMENLNKRMSTVRAGRANPSSLDGVMCEYYGVMTPLKQLSIISVPEGNQLLIKPFDKSALGAIEKAIIAANLGYNPSNDGETIRIIVPALTEERRKELIKQVKGICEDGKVAVRNIRHDAIGDAKDLELSEDELKGVENRIQELVNTYNKKIDEYLKQKEQELCKQIVFSLGKMFTEASRYEVVQAGNGVEAIIVGLITLISEDNRHLISGDNPLYLLLKLILIDWSDDSCIINQISSNIWDYKKQYGWQFLYAFSFIAEQYEKEIKKNRDISINDFFEKNKKLIKQALDKEVSNYSDIDFNQLSIPIMFVIILMIPFKIKEASLVAELTKDIAMKITFDDKDSVQEKYGNIYGYIFNYTMWFADVLLHCDNQYRTMLVNSFLERADFVGNDNVENLLKWLIQEQEIHGKVSEFWSVWETLKPRMLELSHEKDRYYYTDYNGPIGKDRVITSYLFANSEWRENIYRCTLLSEERMDFFDDFIAHTGSFKAVLYSMARLLNTVGKEPYFEKGIQWIYNLIQKDPECRTKLYMNTLYYLEEYVGNYVASHRNDFRVNIVQAQRTQAVLEYMVSQGSHIAFFIREEI